MQRDGSFPLSSHCSSTPRRLGGCLSTGAEAAARRFGRVAMLCTIRGCITLLLIVPALVRAQGTACVPTGALPDSAALALSVMVSKADLTRLPDESAKAIADAIAAAFVMEMIGTLPSYQVAELPGKEPYAYPVVAGEYRFHGVGGTTVKATSLMPALDSALVRAIRQAMASTELSPIVESNTEYSIFLSPHRIPPISATILEMKVPQYAVQRPLRDRHGNGSMAKYTVLVGDTKSSGRLVAWLVVDARGVARRETLQILFGEGKYPEADMRSVLFGRYRPTLINGCAVASFIIRNLDFAPEPR